VATNGTPLRRRHVGELIGTLASDAGTLVRQEIELAKAELQETAAEIRAELGKAAQADAETLSAKSKATAAGAGMFGAAGVTALLALGALTAAAILVLDRVLPTDVAALIVAVVWGLVAWIFVGRGRARLSGGGSWMPQRTLAAVQNVGSAERVLPTETIETVKEDVQWVKTHGRSDAR
jgi:VIT1/CCC1 family predicted Fe2+/Mn2+ transporter